jgi:ElaB/YqjD/DUF883 family membrane-anchored ribosome-binding protein
MRKYISLFFSAIVVLYACNDESAKGVIEEKQMISLLVDVHLVDGSMVMISSAQDTMYKYGTARYLAVFKKHHTDSAQFNKSYRYYTTKPELLYSMYDEVNKDLTKKTDSLNKVFQKQNENAAKQKPNTNAKIDTASTSIKQQALREKFKAKRDSIRRADSLRKVVTRDNPVSTKTTTGKKIKPDTVKKNNKNALPRKQL